MRLIEVRPAHTAGDVIMQVPDPGLLDEVIWWHTDDLWFWTLEALVT